MGKTYSDRLDKERRHTPSIKKWVTQLLNLAEIRDATPEEQREQDIDWHGRIRSGTWFSFEQKIRYKYYDDIAVEVVSCIERKTPGWIYRSKADILVYVFFINGIMKGDIIDMSDLQIWWDTTGKYLCYEEKTAPTYGRDRKTILYHTLNRMVPCKRIPYSFFYYHRDHGLIKKLDPDEVDERYFR